MGKVQKVKIPLERYEELVSLEANAALLIEHTQKQHYSVEREEVAHYLNFKLREHKPPEKELSYIFGKGSDNGKCDHSEEA